jgi:hypothetical protein
MIEADRVPSTQQTDSASTKHAMTRRTALAGLAIMPAIGMPIAAAAEPGFAVAIPDPIFAAIERHRQTDHAKRAKYAEADRVFKLADQTVGPSHIEIPSKTEPGKIVQASGWFDIQNHVPEEKFPELYAEYNALLKERKAAWSAAVGHYGKVDYTQAEYDAAWKALDDFVETVPTTLPGLLAMLAYAHEMVTEDDHSFWTESDKAETLVATLATAAKALGTRLA